MAREAPAATTPLWRDRSAWLFALLAVGATGGRCTL